MYGSKRLRRGPIILLEGLSQEKRITVKIIVLITLAFCLLMKSSLLYAAEEPLEYNLAEIDAGGYIAKDHITVARFRSLLRQLPKHYTESPERIADLTVWAQGSLKKEGMKESLLNIMEGMNQIFIKKQKERYEQFIAAYVTFRTTGKTHAETVSSLIAVVEGFGIRFR